MCTEPAGHLLRIVLVLGGYMNGGAVVTIAMTGSLCELFSESLALGLSREKEIKFIECAAQGLKNKAIAELLIISESTVKTHLYRVYEKLGVNNRLSAVLALKGSAW